MINPIESENWLLDVPATEIRRETEAWYQYEFARLQQLSVERGGLLSGMQAARILGISKQRVSQLVNAGRLEKVSVLDVEYITGSSVREFAKTEKSKGGRPIIRPMKPVEWKPLDRSK